ncbi:MAG: hypothetical protein WC998_04245 [Candidatus Paceibacterota bacterium]|jgi:hypothetical protein
MPCRHEQTESFFKEGKDGREVWERRKKSGKEWQATCYTCHYPLTINENGVCILCGG